MKLGALLTVLGLLMLGIAAVGGRDGSASMLVIRLVWAWGGLSFIVVGFAYFRNAPGLFGKGRDGTTSWALRLLVLPYLMSNWSIWWLRIALTKESTSDEVFKDVWVGRRPGPDDLPSPDTFVVDFASELTAHPAIRKGAYASIPTLDGAAPNADALRAVLKQVDAHQGPVLFHCAFGHGRSAFGAAALLLRRGEFNTAEQALSAMKQRRPGISLGQAQKNSLTRPWTS